MGWIFTAFGAALVWLLMQTNFGDGGDGEVTKYTLILNQSGQGTVTVTAGDTTRTFTGGSSMKIEEGKRVELAIDPDSGYYLGNNPPTSFTMNRDRTVNVEFIKEVVKHDLNVNIEGQGTVKVYVDGELRKTYS